MKKILYLLIVLSCIGITVLISIFYVAPKLYSKEEIVVPDVDNCLADDARKVINNAGLKASMVYQDSQQAIDSVIQCIPKKGTKVKENSIVEIYVSNGQLGNIMPEVSNCYYDDGVVRLEEVIKKLNIKINKIYIDDNELPSDYIAKQFPKKGTRLSENDEVILFVTNETKKIIIPNFSFKTISEAESFCIKNNIELSYEYQYNSKVQSGQIFDQSPKPKSEIFYNKQNQMLVYVSKGPDLSYVPDIIDWDQLEATILLTNLGIKYEIEYVSSNMNINTVLNIEKVISNESLEKVILVVSGGNYERGSSS